jgi:putative transcriptional regulator
MIGCVIRTPAPRDGFLAEGVDMDSLQGQLLIAAPNLVDPNFFKAVVLMVQHTEQGALGVILNRPLETTVEEVWPQVSELPCNAEGSLHQGGPCPGPLMVVHTDPTVSELEVCKGVFFSTDKESIEQLVSQSAGPLKFFVNYAGWSAGQLEGEIESGGWLATPAAREHVFGYDEDLWSTVLRLASRRARLAGIDPRLIPDDPSVN